ncbi:MAG TPA: DUF2182 domain-containing protein, partial [Candidatus Binatia bacterium]
MQALRISPAADRRAFFWLMGSLIAVAWLVIWIWDRSPYGRYLHHAELGELGISASPFLAVVLYLLGWTLMTAAMMLPTSLPLLEIFRRLIMRRPDRSRLMIEVITGYLSVWLLFGIAAHSADWIVHQAV